MNRQPHRDREQLIARLDRLLWVMESVATDGFSKNPAGRGTPNIDETPTTGDSTVARWYDRLTQKLDDLIETNLNRLDEREHKLVGTSRTLQAPYLDVRDAQGRRSEDRCPNCGTTIQSAGRF